MKLGPIIWEPLGILHEKIENTRFILTVMNDGMLIAIVVGLFYLIVRGVTIDAVLFGALNLIIGYLIGSGQLAKKSYFDSRSNVLTEEPVVQETSTK